MGASNSNSLKTFTCLEWKTPFFGGKSEEFVLQNQKFRFHLRYRPNMTKDHVLYIESESKIPVTFEVRVQWFTKKHTETYPTQTVKGIAPFEIWRRDSAAFKISQCFRVMFTESSNVELIEDDKEVETTLKKVTWLEWVAEGGFQNKISPKFMLGDQKCHFTFENCRNGCCPLSTCNLAMDSDKKSRQCFDLAFEVGSNSGAVTSGRKNFGGTPPYHIWASDLLDHHRDITYFRVIVSSCLDREIIEETNLKAGTSKEEGPLTSDDEKRSCHLSRKNPDSTGSIFFQFEYLLIIALSLMTAELLYRFMS